MRRLKPVNTGRKKHVTKTLKDAGKKNINQTKILSCLALKDTVSGKSNQSPPTMKTYLRH